MQHTIEDIYCLASTVLYMLLCTLYELALNSLCGYRLDRTELQCLATHYLSNVTIFSGRPDWRWQQKPCIRLAAEWSDVWCIIQRLYTTFLENQSFEEGAVLGTTGTASILHISLPVLAAYVVQLLAQLEYLHTCNGWEVREQQISKWTYNRNCLAQTAFSAACCVPCLSCSSSVCMHSHCYHSYLLDSATYKRKWRVIKLGLHFAHRRLLISSFSSNLLYHTVTVCGEATVWQLVVHTSDPST